MTQQQQHTTDVRSMHSSQHHAVSVVSHSQLSAPTKTISCMQPTVTTLVAPRMHAHTCGHAAGLKQNERDSSSCRAAVRPDQWDQRLQDPACAQGAPGP